MSKTKTKPIKAILGFNKAAPTVLLARANAVLAGVYVNPSDYANPPIAMADFKVDVDAFSAAITAALDGGKKAVAARSHQSEVVIKALRQLGHYAEANCKDDMPTFLKSGFEAKSTAKSVVQPLSQFIRNIQQGANSGQLLVTLAAVLKASSYDLRWAAVGAGGTPGVWTSQLVSKTRPPTTISGLTPGTTYAFQVRSLVNSVLSDWSDSVTIISM
jgi:hypothetical protein